VALKQSMEMIVQYMQVFDQQVTAVALCRRHANEGTDLSQRAIGRLTTLELGAGLTQLLANLV
jgi:hypothetical protein